MTYVFSEREQEGLREFYQFAFFYGLTEYIPDLHFYPVCIFLAVRRIIQNLGSRHTCYNFLGPAVMVKNDPKISSKNLIEKFSLGRSRFPKQT